ncbi:hypothetical protein FB451DRAFT_1535043 [Mycena latifolia]|nr:hypothetical protein FB451DRAFT_1535043 [Mycena latifolia]
MFDDPNARSEMVEILDRSSSQAKRILNVSQRLGSDSEESAESAFASMLNTPADEQLLHFDDIEGKLIASEPPQILERLETHVDWHARTHRVSLSSKAFEEANKSAAISSFMFLQAGHHEEEELSQAARCRQSTESADADVGCLHHWILAINHPDHAARPPTAAPGHILPRFDTSSVQFGGACTNDSITGEPTSEALSEMYPEDADASKDALALADGPALTLDNNDDCDCDCEFDADLDLPALPRLSPLFPLQLVLFPLWSYGVSSSAAPSCSAPLNSIPSPSLRPRPPHPPCSTVPSPTCCRAHWPAVARLHVAIFLAALVGTAYASPPLGVLLTGACAVLFVRAWRDFVPNSDSDQVGMELEPELGTDVRQTLYQVLLAPGHGFQDEDALRWVGDNYFLVRAPPRAETQDEE